MSLVNNFDHDNKRKRYHTFSLVIITALTGGKFLKLNLNNFPCEARLNIASLNYDTVGYE